MSKKAIRCAIYTRKSSEEGLDQDFNSLDAQREACEAYIKSQKHEGWELIPTFYDDGGFSGGNMDRPALKQLLSDIESNKIEIIVVYKVDRLSRALSDFAQMVDIFDKHSASFVSVTQAFNTTTSMGRLTLNVLLSFAQFEREVTGERIRDKIAASKKKGMWMGGPQPLGYDVVDRKLIVNEAEAAIVCFIYDWYANNENKEPIYALLQTLEERGYRNKSYVSKRGNHIIGKSFSLNHIYKLLRNPIYNGKIRHKSNVYEGEHEAIVSDELWNRVQGTITKTDFIYSYQKQSERPLLAGKLYDYLGNRMSPTYSYKYTEAGRYKMRYYINREIVKSGQVTSEFKRIRAEVIDEAVEVEVTKLIQLLMKKLVASSNHELSSMMLPILKQTEMNPTSIINKVVLYPKYMELSIMIDNASEELELFMTISLKKYKPQITKIENGLECRIAITANYKRANGQMQIIASNQNADKSKPTHVYPDDKTFNMLAKGFYWSRQLEKDERLTLKAIAERDHHSLEYVKKAVKLRYLSPRVVEQITSNHAHSQINVETLNQCNHWNWEEQEVLLLNSQ